MEWSQEKVLTLIDLYRERPVLWDASCKNYKDRNKRNDALTEINFAMDVPKDEISRKIKNLQSHFSRELKKERDSQRSGTETDAIYKSNWFAYQAMQFLRDKNKPNATRNTEDMVVVHPSGDPEEVQNATESENSENIENVENTSGNTQQTNTERNPVIEIPYEKPAVPEKNIPTRKRKADTPVCEAYSIMKEIYSTRQARDLFTVFGEQVGMRVRNLPTEHAKIYVPHIINTILFEAELGKYNYTTKPATGIGTQYSASQSSQSGYSSGFLQQLQPLAPVVSYSHAQSHSVAHGSQQRVYTDLDYSSESNLSQPSAFNESHTPIGPLSSESIVSQPPTPSPLSLSSNEMSRAQTPSQASPQSFIAFKQNYDFPFL